MVERIASEEDLESWLEARDSNWARALAIRSSLRSFPILLDPQQWRSGEVDPKAVLAVLRCLVYAPMEVFPLDKARDAIESVDRMSATKGKPSVYAAARTAIYALRERAPAAARASADAAAYAVEEDDARQAAWRAVAADCLFLEQKKDLPALMSSPLWPSEPEALTDIHRRGLSWLARPAEGFLPWHEWYVRIQRGEHFEFEWFDEASQREFYRRLHTRNELWNREPAEVNVEIARWVEELRRTPPADTSLDQNPAVINFALDDEARTTLAPEPLPNGLQDDPDARDTHAEICRLIVAARLASEHGRTQADDVTAPLNLLADATGAAIEDVRPRLLVLRGKEIIRQFEERQKPDTLSAPLSAGQVDSFAPLIEAIRQFVDEDPKLRKLWQGPQGDEPPLSKPQIKALVEALDAQGQITPEAQEPLATAIEQIPANAGADNPARRTASEMVRNVVRSIGKAFKRVDDGSKSAERWVKLGERMTQVWTKVRDYLPDDDTLARILEWISRSGG